MLLSLLVSLCCEGEEAVTSTLSMGLSPTGAWRLPPASPVLTSVSSAGGMYLKNTATGVASGASVTKIDLAYDLDQTNSQSLIPYSDIKFIFCTKLCGSLLS